MTHRTKPARRTPDHGSGSRPSRLTALATWLASLTLATAQSPPSSFTEDVSTASDTVTVDFVQHPIRGSNFEVLVQDSSGSINTHSPADSRIYFGTVQGHPGARAAGLLKTDDTLICRVYFENGVEWSSTGGTASIRGGTGWSPEWPTTVVPSGGAGSSVYAAELGIDASYDEYVAAGSTIDDTVELAEFCVMASNLSYLRDAAILHRIGKVVVRTSQTHCPYDPHGGDTGLLLNEVKDQWNNVLSVGSTHDLALVAEPDAGGGLAWVGAIGTSNRYSANGADANGDFSVVWRHEGGHNWGSGHYEGGGNPEGPTIMSNNQLSRFSSSELERILAHRDTKTGVLDNLGGYSFDLPPRANGDRAHFVVGRSVTLDVLDNDSDSNGESIDILSFDSTTALGGTVSVSSGTGPGGRDELTYTPPAGLTSGTDHFTYRIEDAGGDTATGYVTLRPSFNDSLAAHWTLDDGGGDTAKDTTSSGYDGSVAGGATWTTGRIGGGLTLDGSDDHVTAPALDLDTNTVSFTGWIRRNGSQNDWAGLAFCRDGSSAGLNFGPDDELRYHWGAGSNPSYNFDSGLVPPDDTWTFVALVVSPDDATIHMKPAGSSLQSATATGTFAAQSFGGAFHLGHDPNSGSRRFAGDMDDFRVFRKSLSTAEITALAGDGGTPSAPVPAVGGTKITGIPFDLEWSAAPSSTSYEVYLGGDYATVRDATTASDEYAGSSSSADLDPGALAAGTWFWRIDASDGTTTLKGPVWHFDVVDDPAGLTAWWKMNDGSGTTATDASPSGADGTITGATWGTGKRDGALAFDGDDQIACGTAASLDGATPFSVGAWVKIPASHSSQAILVQQRGPSGPGTNGYNGQYQLRVDADGTPSFWVYGNSATQFNFSGSTALDDGQWHHVLGIRDGAEGRIYVDGTLDATASGTVRDLVSNIPVYLGCDGRDDNRHLDGSLDEVRIYDRALSTDEIQALINRAPAFTSDPVEAADAEEAVAYSGSLDSAVVDHDTPAGETLTFTKLSGPSWLTIGSGGSLSGTPYHGDAGLNSFGVRVTDAAGASDDATLEIQVGPPPAGQDTDSDGYPDQLETALGVDPYSSGSQPDPIYADLHSWWRFDESSGSTAADDSGYQHPGSVSGATWSAGKDGNALLFDGTNDTVAADAEASLLGTTDFTLGAWIKIDAAADLGTVIQQRDTGDGYQGEYMFNVNDDGTLNFFIHNSGYQFDITTTATVNDDEWHHVAAVREGGDGYIYIDGVESASGSGTVKELLARTVAIGYDHRDSNRHFDGLIDDVRVYSRALSGSELMSIADPTALPPGWTGEDVGSVGVTGDAGHSNGTFTVSGSGSDIWGTADGFHYVHQPLSGDGEITARVVSVEQTHNWAKAGVMIRESLTAGSKHGMIVITPQNGASFQRRATTGGSSASTTDGGVSAPYWVRLVRSGNTLTAYRSSDGGSWTQVGSQSISMASNISIGLVVTSHNNGTDCEAVFDNVSVTP